MKIADLTEANLIEDFQRQIITDEEFTPIVEFIKTKHDFYEEFDVGNFRFKLKHSRMRPVMVDGEVKTYQHVLDLVYASKIHDHPKEDRRPPKQLFLTLNQKMEQVAKSNGYQAIYAYGVANKGLDPLFANLGFHQVDKETSGSFMTNWLKPL